MWQRSLLRRELDEAERERGHCRKGMERDRGRGIQQRRKTHGKALPSDSMSERNR
jgi:hypothetical protein